MKARLIFGWLAAVAVGLVFWGGLGPAQADTTILVDRGMPEWNELTDSSSNINGINNPNRVNTSTMYSYK
jgi:hypothetical protein